MNIAALIIKLDKLKTEQLEISDAWKKTGNRAFLEYMTELLPMALQAERCSIFISNPDDNSVWIHCGTELKEKQIMVPSKESVVGEVIASGKKIIDNALHKRIGVHDIIALKTGFTAHNTLCVPVLDPKSHITAGAIQLLNKCPAGSDFSEEDALLVEKLAHHMHINISNIFLSQEMANITLEIGKEIEQLEENLLQQGVPI